MQLSTLTTEQKINLLNAFANIIQARQADYKEHIETENPDLLEAYNQYRFAEIGTERILHEINLFI